MSHFEAIVRAHDEGTGRMPRFLESGKVAAIVINCNEVIKAQTVPGIEVTVEPLTDGVRILAAVAPGVKIEQPVHLCIGVMAPKAVQNIYADFEIGAGAEVDFTACCSFPNAEHVQHRMEGTIHVGPGATMRYHETHHHGRKGGIDVVPTSRIIVDAGGRYISDFNLSKGRAGKVELTYLVDVAANALAELNAKGMGYGDDRIIVHETIRLNGENARGLAKARIAVRDRAHSEVYGTTEGNAPFARGHVDCVEIVQDQATASAVPVVKVTDHRAQVTHEASIGSVDKRELETLMAHRVDEQAAVDMIVRGMLGE